MFKYISRSLLVCSIVATGYGTGNAEIRKAAIPDLDEKPGLHSVRAKSFKKLLNRENRPEKTNGATLSSVTTNGTVLDGGNIIVDDIEDPECVFYGNYNDTTSGKVTQSFDIDTIIFECK